MANDRPRSWLDYAEIVTGLPQDPTSLGFWLTYTLVPALILAGVARWMIWRHERRLRAREAAPRLWVSTGKTPPPDAHAPALLTANVVLSYAAALRLLILLRKLIGGRLDMLQRMLERGRREALLRLEDKARARGYQALYGLRFDCARLSDPEEGGDYSMELIAYATAVKLKDVKHGHPAQE
ncbi:MAG: heavy metal-binding domain-containing protein [Rhodothalassiaceae bacterium]